MSQLAIGRHAQFLFNEAFGKFPSNSYKCALFEAYSRGIYCSKHGITLEFLFNTLPEINRQRKKERLSPLSLDILRDGVDLESSKGTPYFEAFLLGYTFTSNIQRLYDISPYDIEPLKNPYFIEIKTFNVKDPTKTWLEIFKGD